MEKIPLHLAALRFRKLSLKLSLPKPAKPVGDTKKILIFISVLLLTYSCKKSQLNPAGVSAGSANFSTFVSVGNSLTQGFMDGGLYAYGQSNSYPSIIAGQMQLTNPSLQYTQPTVTGNGSGYYHLAYINGQLTPVEPGDTTYGSNPYGADPSWSSWGTNFQNQQISNLGVASFRLTDCVALTPQELVINAVICGYQNIPPYGTVGNPYGRFINFGSYFSPRQYIDAIRASKATFFTCWLGNNDVLLFATNGGVIDSIPGTAFGTVYLNTITAPAEFAQKYDSVLTAFSKLGAQGICATVPDITSIPFFNTVPSYINVNGANQYLYIHTNTGIRRATANDLILLTAYDSVLAGEGLTYSTALGNDLVLDASEISEVENATTQYNAAIKSAAVRFGYGVVDMYQFFTTFQKSVTIDGISFSRQFIQGGCFGLDGIHPNAKGYSIVANQFILAINSRYGSTLPPADITKYKGVIFPDY